MTPNFRSQFPQTAIQLFSQLVNKGYTDTDLELIRDAVDFSRRVFACRVHTSGKLFISHNVGAAGVLAAIGERPTMIAAALVHNVYGNGYFAGNTTGDYPARRTFVRQALGNEIEQTVRRFHVTQWDPDTLRQWLRLNQLDDDQRDLLALRLADAIDHAVMFGMAIDPSDDSWKFFDERRDDMVELARKHGLGQLADVWLELLGQYSDYAVIPEVQKLMKFDPWVVRPRSHLPGPRILNVRVRRAARRILRST